MVVSEEDKLKPLFMVYLHTRKTDGVIFYVGMCKAVRRLTSKGDRNAAWHTTVETHWFSSLVVAEGLTFSVACEVEKELIAKYRVISGTMLVNIAGGGVGCLGVPRSEATKAKWREKVVGQKRTDEAKSRMSAWQVGKPKSIELRAKFSLSALNKPKVTTETKAKLSQAAKLDWAKRKFLKLQEVTL